MVQEYRKIVLSTEELISAYESHRRMNPGFLPPGKITHCRMAQDGTITLTLVAAHGDETKIVCRGMDVVKPLIRFCLENNVILPRDGRKSISIEEGSAALNITLTLHVDMVDSFVPMRTVHMAELAEVMADAEINEAMAVVTV